VNVHVALVCGGLKLHVRRRLVETRVAHCIPLLHRESVFRSSQISIDATPSLSTALAV
jgi:hypothetical protein